jgi:hypothetical protein
MFQTNSHAMKKFVPLLIAVAAGYFLLLRPDSMPDPAPREIPAAPTASRDAGFVAGSQVKAAGIVDRLLEDDNDGSRHQRFILQLDSGRTLLIAHNIDVAPRIEGLRQGDRVEFSGEFEPNAQGGVIHWTHRDPLGEHENGWLKHDGQTYQ